MACQLERDRTYSSVSALCNNTMAPKKLIAGPQLIGQRQVFVLLLSPDVYSFEGLECSVALKEILRRLPIGGHHHVSPVTVDVVVDAISQEVQLVNKDLCSAWVEGFKDLDRNELGTMVAIQRGLRRLYYRTKAGDRDDFYVLFLDTRVVQPTPSSITRLCDVLQTSHTWFTTPPALVALSHAGPLDAKGTSIVCVPHGCTHQADMKAMYLTKNTQYNHEETYAKDLVSTAASLIHSNVVVDIITNGWRHQHLQSALFGAVAAATRGDWNKGMVITPWPPSFGEGPGGWAATDQGKDVTAREVEGCAIIVDFDDYSGFSNRLHLLAFAMTAAHYTSAEVIAIWGWSPQCPALFHDTWKVAPWQLHHKCRGLTIVERNSKEHEEALKGLSRTEADMFGFGSAETCLHNFVKNVNDIRKLEGKPLVQNVLPDLHSYWRLLQPRDDVANAARFLVEQMKARSGCTMLVGVHFRRGDLRSLMEKQHDRRDQPVDYDTFDKEFFKTVGKYTNEGWACFVAVDTMASLEAWRQEFRDSTKVFFTEDLSRRLVAVQLGKYYNARARDKGAREFTHLRFTLDVELLRRCDAFVGTAESSVRQVITDGRHEPFEETKLIGVVPYSFVNLCGRLAPAVKKLAFRLQPRWQVGISSMVGQLLQLSPQAQTILAEIPLDSLVQLRDLLLTRMAGRITPEVSGSSLGTVEMPPAIEVAREAYKKLQQDLAGKNRKRHLGFLSAVCWLRLRDISLSDNLPCPLPTGTGHTFKICHREDLAGDACLQKFLDERMDTSCCTVQSQPETEDGRPRKPLPHPRPLGDSFAPAATSKAAAVIFGSFPSSSSSPQPPAKKARPTSRPPMTA